MVKVVTQLVKEHPRLLSEGEIAKGGASKQQVPVASADLPKTLADIEAALRASPTQYLSKKNMPSKNDDLKAMNAITDAKLESQIDGLNCPYTLGWWCAVSHFSEDMRK